MDCSVLHADGTDCPHLGDPQAGPDGVRCPAGIPVTHIRVNSQVLTFAEAVEGFAAICAAFTRAFDLITTTLTSVFTSPAWSAAIRSAEQYQQDPPVLARIMLNPSLADAGTSDDPTIRALTSEADNGA